MVRAPALVAVVWLLTFAWWGCGSEAPSRGSGGGGVGGTIPTGGSGGQGVGGELDTSHFGAPCESDEDCAGLTCVAPGEPAGEGPNGTALAIAHGMCTRHCADDPTACDDLDPGALCGEGLCYPSCWPGPADLEQPDPAKCQGRSDLACTLGLDGSQPFCLPTCNSDSDCGGLSCYAGGCTSELVSGAPIGASAASDAECADGFAFQVEGQAALCTAACTYGVIPSCGWEGSGPAQTYCAWTETLGAGYGDAAACIELCSCSDPCTHPDAICYVWESLEPVEPALLVELDHDGLCLLPEMVGGALALDCGG